MTIHYVGPVAAGAADGTSWANRYGSLNDAEDTPVVAGDTVYVGPGVYRELLTVDVSGGAGTEIVYIGDVTGENTDGVGGIVRITGSDNDQTSARNQCLVASSKNYRTFRGFVFDTAGNGHTVDIDSCTYFTFEDCLFFPNSVSNMRNIDCTGASQSNLTVRRCRFFQHGQGGGIYFGHGATVDDTGHVIDNCFFHNGVWQIYNDRIGGITVTNSAFIGAGTIYAVKVNNAQSVGQVFTVENSIFTACVGAISAPNVAQVIEDYNSIYACATARQNTNVGANSNTYPPLFEAPLLLDEFNLPWQFGALSEWSQLAAITDNGSGPTDDLHGITRPVTNGKRSWGAIQYRPTERDTATTYDGSAASLKFPDAGSQQFYVPTENVATTFTVQVYREANYAGVNPQMIIKQPGQADVTVTDVGAAGAWNELTTTITPAADPPYVKVELRSLNTAVAGNYATYFDEVQATPTASAGDLDNWITNREVPDTIQQEGGGGVARGVILSD